MNFQYSRDNLPDEIGLEATLPLSVDLGTPQVAIIGNTAGNDPREVPVTTRIYDARQAPFECEPGKTCIWRGEAKACHESVVVAPPPPMWAAEVDTSMYPAAHFGVHSLAASSCCDDWIFERSGTGRIFSVSVAAPYYVQQQPPMNPGCPGGGGD
ncbi:MAG: hypothetical protein KDD64_04975 [Bdellovibrionales bacterium]|nr:hypothetical protein [Bdellovibrionales bacterium]